jgi:hypothetical protein
MLSDTEQSGLLTFMFGVIVVVLVGVGLSMLVDSRFGFSSGAVETETRIEADAKLLESLAAHHDQISRHLATTEPLRRARHKERTAIRAATERRELDLEKLTAARTNLQTSVEILERGFSDYRAKYREAARAAAVGRSLGDLKIRGGRTYQKAVIAKVTDVGLEIRHEHGLARVQAPDLAPALQDEFQWDDEERRARLKRELANHRAIATRPAEERSPTPRGQPAPQPETPMPDEEKAEALRNQVRMWMAGIARISAERSAAYSSSYSGNRSVPGSLETHQSKVARLDAQLAKARAELAAAKALLARVSPGDPLLRPDARP